jgi:uncharacterized protein YjbI with pentapeptide repeats
MMTARMDADAEPFLVRPRVFHPTLARDEPILLEDAVHRLLDRGARGLYRIDGPAGSGKSTAIAHLREVFEPRARNVVFLDDAVPETLDPVDPRILCVHVLRGGTPVDVSEFLSFPSERVLKLAPWSRDDIIEYLLAAHPQRCASVLARYESGAGAIDPRGNAEVARAVLDEMASDETITAVDAAILRIVERDSAGRFRRLHAARILLLAVDLAQELAQGRGEKELVASLHPDVERAAYHTIARDQAAIGRLGVLLEDKDLTVSQCAARFVNHFDPRAILRWIESSIARAGIPPCLDLHRLPGVDLRGLCAREIKLSHARLHGADVSFSDIRDASLNHADLRGGMLREANLDGSKGYHTSFSRADLTDAHAAGARWERADLRGAILRRVVLAGSYLRSCRFDEADLTNADLSSTDLTGASVDGALLVDVDFSHAELSGVHLSRAHLASSRFAHARLEKVQLEGIHLDKPDFSNAKMAGALLTGSHMRAASFEAADLHDAGLADVDWEGADLRGADLKHASFHLGPARAGPVFQAPAMDWTRTGFYRDDFALLRHRPPEEVRKANLRNADLRSARVMETDFYLVDLRGVRCDDTQRAHFRRCGAILDGWGL